MALQQCGLDVNRSSRELIPHGTKEFPCAGYESTRTTKEEDVISWHWHEEMEFIYVKDGNFQIKTPSKKYHLKTGESIFINSNTPHYGIAEEYCEIHSFVFHEMLITGNENSAFAKKYIRPLLDSKCFSSYVITKQDDCYHEVCEWIQVAFDALKNDSFGYEFIVRENLSKILLHLYQKNEGNIHANTREDGVEQQRIKEMLSYIHAHFSEEITLSDIASVVGIGERECLRCFQKTIQLSPIQYLLKYRIMQGAEALLQYPAKSVAEVAGMSGFDSPSNFSKTFKRFYKQTPREYRKQYLA